MDRRLPPLNALRAFEVASRHLSFTKAADELAVTQAAVSYQIRQLEEHVGRELFVRLTRRLELTPAGVELQGAVQDAFDRIRSTMHKLTDAAEDKVLSVTTLSTFASHWLVPRLGHFQLRHPDLAVRLDSSVTLGDLNHRFDVAIRAGKGQWPGMRAERLVEYTLTPVLSPILADRMGGISQPSDLTRLPLLDYTHPDDVRYWHEWFALAGVAVERVRGGPQYDVQSITGQAAVMGQGAALVCPAFFAADIAAGRLVLPFPDLILRTDRSYWLVCAQRRVDEPKIQAFRDWILSEVSACAGQCGALGGMLNLTMMA
jgi:LysR family transcriptional regulator, glycine cleavage system transcriptional activator